MQCKREVVFNKADYNSSDGMLTTVWGPSMWHSLHTISFNYPVKPTPEDKQNYYKFFMGLHHVLPCKYCRINLKTNLKSVPLTMKTMKNRHTLSLWLYLLHEKVNKMLGKKSGLKYTDIRNRYEMFRSRCITDKKIVIVKKRRTKKKEKGCVKPLYGIKSKCVISIVPKNKKCKTFKIDRRCALKR
tara:strand:+ start:83 stop:640 length:558 start_codon:yes stop_codon:yes gene_type:complete